MSTSSVRNRDNTRSRLLVAALDLMSEASPQSITVDRLVSEAGFTRGAFYSNFSSMDEVYVALFDQQAGLMIDTMRAALGDDPQLDLGIDLVQRVLSALQPHGRRWFILISELMLRAVRDPHRRDQYLTFQRRSRAQLAEVLGEALLRLGRRASPSLEVLAEVVAVLYLSSLGDDEVAPGGGAMIQSVLPTVILSLSEPIDQA